MWDDPQESEKRGKQLYLATLLLEIPGFFLRFVLVYAIGFIIVLPLMLNSFASDPFGFSQSRGSMSSEAWLWLVRFLAFVIAGLPFVFSIATFLFGGGYYLTRFAMGAREPSKREREAVLAALETVSAQTPPGTIAPTKWYVIDNVTLTAFVVGSTLYLTRELIQSRYLAPVIAHELGHINSFDGRLTLALRRLVLAPVHLLAQALGQPAPGNVVIAVPYGDMTAYTQATWVWLLSFFMSVAGGGLGLLLLNPLWVWYWRGREYFADYFAAQVNQVPALIEYLERNQFFDVAVPYFMATHPYTELRIDKLMAYEQGARLGAPAIEPAPVIAPAVEGAD
jgi:Zn-dependent protease with chaperone function